MHIVNVDVDVRSIRDSISGKRIDVLTGEPRDERDAGVQSQ